MTVLKPPPCSACAQHRANTSTSARDKLVESVQRTCDTLTRPGVRSVSSLQRPAHAWPCLETWPCMGGQHGHAWGDSRPVRSGELPASHRSAAEPRTPSLTKHARHKPTAAHGHQHTTYTRSGHACVLCSLSRLHSCGGPVRKTPGRRTRRTNDGRTTNHSFPCL